MNGLDTILEKSEDIKFDREHRIRELVRVNNIMGTVKSHEIEGELLGKYSVWFKTLKEANTCKEGLNDDKKTVLVTIKEVGNRWSVIKNGRILK